MWRIFVPLRYLRIAHPEKWKFDIGLPLIFWVIFAAPLLSEEFRRDSLRSLDMLEKLGGFLGVLTGFFIAALAAVATFGKSEMDDPMPGDPPVRLQHRENLVAYSESLSRRRFLSFLFGYMAWVALALYVIGYVYPLADKYLFRDVMDSDGRELVFSLFWIFYTFAFANVLSNTLLGLFYLTDRIHRPNKKAEWKGATNEVEDQG